MQNYQKIPSFNFIAGFAWLLGLFICAPLAKGQTFGTEMLGGKKALTIPFEYHGGFLVVDIVYGNTFPLKFVFDTGAEHTILFKRIYSDLLGTVYSQKIKIYGADLSENITALIARDVAIKVDEATTINKDFVVMEQNLLDLEEDTGVRIDGILGGEYFRGLVVEINYKKSKITLYNPDKFDKNMSKYTKIPAVITRNKPYVFATYSENNDTIKSAKMLLDSGASLGCLFHHNSDISISLPSKVISGSLGRGLGGDIEGFMGKIRQLNIGDFEFNNLVANYQELDTIILSSDAITRNGIIGNLLLERFNVIINYQKEEVYLKPHGDYNKAFKYDKSGIFLYAFGPNLDQYFVKSVIKNSPADLAGIKEGDIIKKVGWWSTRWYSLQRLSNKFSGKAGKKIKLKVERQGECLGYEFKLKDLFEEDSIIQP